MGNKRRKKRNFYLEFGKDSEVRFMTFVELLEKACMSFMNKKVIIEKS